MLISKNLVVYLGDPPPVLGGASPQNGFRLRNLFFMLAMLGLLPVALGVLAGYAIRTGNAPEAQQWFSALRRQPSVAPNDVALLAREYQERFGRVP